jgi:hypothetical protein
VYYALIGESLHGDDAETDPDVLASRVVDTLLRGAGRRQHGPGRDAGFGGGEPAGGQGVTSA